MLLQLTKPAIVRGRVLDSAGNPVANREVRALDKLGNRFYDPQARTSNDGTFELKFVRPGEQYLQVSPYWWVPDQAPREHSKKVVLTAGQELDGLELNAGPEPKADNRRMEKAK